jgi:hypothetical protein
LPFEEVTIMPDLGTILAMLASASTAVALASTFRKGTPLDAAVHRQTQSMRMIYLGLILSFQPMLWPSIPKNLEIGFSVAGAAMIFSATWMRWRRRRVV